MNKEFKYISDISIEQFCNDIVLPFTSEEGKPCILIRNSKNKQNLINGATDNLKYHLNSVFCKDGQTFYFHMIACLKADNYSKEQFNIAYEYLFKEMKEPKSDFDIGMLINSLEQLFKITPEKNLLQLHVGVYGELLYIIHLVNNGCNEIVSTYHSNFYSKHDFEIDRYNRIEIKTTLGGKRIHHFSQDQIFRNDINVYVGSVLLEESSEGVSLEELFEMVNSKITNPKSMLFFGKLKGFCGVSKDNVGPRFSFDKANSLIKTFKATELPHLEIGDVKGISNISYDVDCSTTDNIDDKEFIELVNLLIAKNS